MSPSEINTPSVRAALKVWTIRNRWTADELCAAMRLAGVTYVLTPYSMTRFSKGLACPRWELLVGLAGFLDANPNPGGYDAFVAKLAARKVDENLTNDERAWRRLVDRDRERQEHVRRHLAREHQPKVREHSVLFGLDKATVMALTGGVRT